jgi:probable rRNA maturation factor
MAELSVVLVDAEAMEALHKQWMELDGPTDVMAFPMDGSDGRLDRFDPSAPLTRERLPSMGTRHGH